MEKYLYEDLYELENQHWWHIAKRKTVLSLIKKFANESSPKILDIGCGTGGNLTEFAKVGIVFGIDQSSEAIEFCKKRGFKNVKVGCSEKTGFPSNSFDVVTMLDVLEHVEEDNTLKEIRRILKKDGVLIVTVPAFSFLWSKWDEVLHHKRRYTESSLKTVFRTGGFKVKKISYLYSFLILPAVIIRFIKSFKKSKEYSSDFKLSNRFINQLMFYITDFERNLMQKKHVPFGTSIVAVTSKHD